MKIPLTATLLLAPHVLFAQQLVSASADRNQINVNDIVKFTLEFKADNLVWCGLKVKFGDGEERDIRVEHLPLVLTKEYAAAGRYQFHAEGKLLIRGVMTAIPCFGQGQSVPIIVTDRPAAPKPAVTADVNAKERDLAERERQLREREAALERQKVLRDTSLDVPVNPQRSGNAAPPPSKPALPAVVKPKLRPPTPASAPKPKDETLKIFNP